MSGSATRTPITWREGRRLRAWQLFQQGWRQGEIAAALGVSPGAVSQWLSAARQAGAGALRQRARSGRPPRLSPAQQAQVPGLLARGATTFGFRGDRWTRARVAELLRREFAVVYHPTQVGRWLRRWGWTRQKPRRRARQRDEVAITRWRKEQYPAVVKRGAG